MWKGEGEFQSRKSGSALMPAGAPWYTPFGKKGVRHWNIRTLESRAVRSCRAPCLLPSSSYCAFSLSLSTLCTLSRLYSLSPSRTLSVISTAQAFNDRQAPKEAPASSSSKGRAPGMKVTLATARVPQLPSQLHVPSRRYRAEIHIDTK